MRDITIQVSHNVVIPQSHTSVLVDISVENTQLDTLVNTEHHYWSVYVSLAMWCGILLYAKSVPWLKNRLKNAAWNKSINISAVSSPSYLLFAQRVKVVYDLSVHSSLAGRGRWKMVNGVSRTLE